MSANVEILKSFLLSRERQGFSIRAQARIHLYYFLDSSTFAAQSTHYFVSTIAFGFRWNDNILDVNDPSELL